MNNRANEGGIFKYAMFITRWRHASPFPLIALYLYTKKKKKNTFHCSVYPCYTHIYICAFVSSPQQLHSITAQHCSALLLFVKPKHKPIPLCVCRACDRDRFEIYTHEGKEWGSANRMQHSFVSVCLMLFTHLDIVLCSVRVFSAPSEFIQRK